jgi:hypothetical protein
MTVKLEIDTSQLIKDLDGYLLAIKELTKPKVLEQISKAIFSITGERFMIDVDNYARINPKKMHHVYEWGKVGLSNARLFELKREVILNGSLIVSTNFLPSKMPVPISPELLIPGRTGKTVSRRSIFANKATVMEAGTPVSFTAKRMLAFMGNNGIAFISPGTQINILHPGGLQTKNSFATYMLEWYTKNGNTVMDASGFYERMANDVAVVLNSNKAGITQIQAAITNLANQINIGSVIR